MCPEDVPFSVDDTAERLEAKPHPPERAAEQLSFAAKQLNSAKFVEGQYHPRNRRVASVEGVVPVHNDTVRLELAGRLSYVGGRRGAWNGVEGRGMGLRGVEWG